jgi:hypothetical protein
MKLSKPAYVGMAVAALALSFTQVAPGYPGGASGCTLKTSTAGCGGSGCHGSTPNMSVQVVISGPATIVAGQTAAYTVTVTGTSGTKGGVDIAVSNGTLAPASSFLRLTSGELVHSQRVSVPSTYQFNYTAPSTPGTVTIYATGKDNVFSGWNFAASLQTTITPPLPSAPTLVSPPNGSFPTWPTYLIWRRPSGAIGYRLQIAIDSLFTSIILMDTTLVDTTYLWHYPIINSAFFWRAAARNTSGWGPWSDTWHFHVSAPMIPSTLVSPAPGAVITADSVRLVWNGNPLATTYAVQYAIDSLFSNAQTDSVATDTFRVLRPLSALTYWWRLRAGNPVGWGPYSAARNFTVVLTDVRPSAESPLGFVLEQNFPNPFNPTTQIRFEVPEALNVLLKVYDVTGREIETLVNTRLAAGRHTAIWTAADHPSGVYWLRLEAAGFVVSKKMVLIR